jgi:hypothetical protein
MGISRAPEVARARSVATRNRSQAATESTSGFSQMTCTPAAKHCSIWASCIDGGVHRSTTSTSAARSASSESTVGTFQSCSALRRRCSFTSAMVVTAAPSTPSQLSRCI